ncbi:MAG: glycerol kinase GlpK [Eubacteriales bacterium]|nr:glycerol kinase GlpK [Eubacteriales bacterium]
MKYIMAMDAGTTSARCILFDHSGTICAMAQRELTVTFPKEGWVEQDAREIWEAQLAVCHEALQKAGLTGEDIAAIGIPNQRETTIVWDRQTGEPVGPAIVWQCRRTAEAADALKRRGLADSIRRKTGLIIDAYFSATKLQWILDRDKSVRARAECGELLFGTVESWLIWNLTGGVVHCTEYSNAARTMLFNIHTLDWDEDILRELNIPRQMLPQPVPSSGVMAETEVFGARIPIAGAAGDQQAALFGQNCFEPGEAKNTYGTGCFLLMNTGTQPVESRNGLLTTVAWGFDGTVSYALEGSVFVAGAAIQWLRDELGLIHSAAETEELAYRIADTGGVYLVPAFVGLGAPYWDSYARGTLVGMTRGTGRAHIVRAALESLAYQTADVLEAMQNDSGIALRALKADGGASRNNFLMEFQGDIVGVPIVRPQCVETTALGAAYLAGLAVGYWNDVEEIRRNTATDRIFAPQMSQEQRERLMKDWHRAVQCASGWAVPADR